MAEYAPITIDHEWFIGEKKTFEFTIRNGDGSIPDITNWDLEWVCRPHAESTTVFLRKVSTVGGEINKTDAQNGVCQVLIGPGDYSGFVSAGEYDHALRRTDGDSDAVLAFGEAVLRAAAAR